MVLPLRSVGPVREVEALKLWPHHMREMQTETEMIHVIQTLLIPAIIAVMVAAQLVFGITP